MAAPRRSRFEEICIWLGAARDDADRASRRTETEPRRAYDAGIYTRLSLDGLSAPRGRPHLAAELAGLPLVAVERVVVRWSQYREYLEAFHEGEKAVSYMRGRLLETMSDGLERLFPPPSTGRAVRLWLASEAPELRELPWELVAYPRSGPADPRFSLVRGAPGEWAPLVLVEHGLRLALIHEPARTPPPLAAALAQPVPGLTVVPLAGPVRQALHRAAREGFELVHLVADGSVSLGGEGVLALGDGERVAPREVSSLLAGSRVSVLALTPAVSSRLSPGEVPTVFRAFAHLGYSAHPLPSLVAPVGPLVDKQVEEFWRLFYRTLAESLSVEEAVVRGRAAASAPPMALFLRHRLGREFVRPTARATPMVEPTRLSADLQVARQLVEQLRAVDSNFAGLEGNISGTPLLERESARQEQVEQGLTSWTQLDEDTP